MRQPKSMKEISKADSEPVPNQLVTVVGWLKGQSHKFHPQFVWKMHPFICPIWFDILGALAGEMVWELFYGQQSGMLG